MSRPTRPGLIPLSALLSLLVALPHIPLGAATYTVSSRNDAGTGSLRQAILNANSNAGPDLIQVTATGVIALQSPLPVISDATTLVGPGTNRLVLDGGGSRRLLATAAGATVSVRGLTLANGQGVAGAHGGAISNAGTLWLREVIISNSVATAAWGGAIYNHMGAVLQATQVLFVANAVLGGDGQDRSSVDSGGGGGGGGGLGGAVFNAGQALFHACEFLCNNALGGQGGDGGGDGLGYLGGQGGGPNGGAGGGMDFSGAAASGLGGGGGGGGGTDFGFVDDGGMGGLGGGGGGAGARRFSGSGGSGGAAGYFGGRGGTSCCGQAGAGGGGAGLGGAVFAARGAGVQFSACRFSRNLAWHGTGGRGAPGVGDGTDGAGAGGAVFGEDPADVVLGAGNEFTGNAASTAFADVTAGWIRVTTLANAGPGSLRDALATAASTALPTSIFVDSTNGVVALAAPLAFPAGQTFVCGPGWDRLTLSGGSTVRVLEVGAGAVLALRDLTLANGRSTNVSGGGLRNLGGQVVMQYCAVISNLVVGAEGGGIYNGGVLRLQDTRITHNLVRGQNGESRLVGTSGGGGGGGAALGGGLFSEGTLRLERCLVLSNTVAGGHGGVGGESGANYAGGTGGGLEGALAGLLRSQPGGTGGFGGGGGGGAGGEDPLLSPGGQGGPAGFGGGGGGGGATRQTPDAMGGLGGAGSFGGQGGYGTNAYAGGGGGGAGLGAGLFVRGGDALLIDCVISGNRATNGVGGAGGAGLPFGAPAAPGQAGSGAGGGLFDLTQSAQLHNTSISGNNASGSNANSFVGSPYSLTTTADAYYIVNPGPGTNIVLTAQPVGVGPFHYQWFFLGNLVGTNRTLTISNFSLALAGVYQVVVTTPAGTYLSALQAVGARATPVPDTARPTLTLTAPATASLRVTSNSVRFAGTAKDPSGIGGVSITPAQPGAAAILASGVTNWSALVPLQPGTNHFTVVATDRAYNQSLPQTRTVYYAVSNRLKITLSGQGTVLPHLNNLALEVGKGYSVQATPAAGYVFRHWRAGTFPEAAPISESPTLAFLMASNLNLEAVFVPNPFPPAAGAYNGLFSEADETRLERSGAVNLTVTTLGAFSGTLRTATKRLALSGQFNAVGRSTNTVPRTGTTPLTVELHLQLDGSGRLAGRVTDGAWSASLEATLAPFNATTRPATNQVGSHTLAQLWDDGRVGWVASVTVNSAGLTKLSGSLFDTPSITQQMAMDGNGSWPLFVPLYGGRGQLLGRLQFGAFGTDTLTGRVSWVKGTLPTSLSAARTAPTAFTNLSAVIGSRYPTPVTNRVLNFSLGVVELDGGDLTAAFTNQVALSSANVVTNLSPNPLTLAITKTTGLFSGKGTQPGTNRVASFKGVVLPQRGYGLGFFPGTNDLGQVYFGPPTP